MKPTSSKATLIKLVHTGRRSLGLTDEEYRALLSGLTGHASARDLSEPQLQRVIADMRRQGFGKDLWSSPQMRKIRALWLNLVRMKGVREKKDAAILAYMRRILGDSASATRKNYTPGELSTVIESLKKWISRLESKEVFHD